MKKLQEFLNALGGALIMTAVAWLFSVLILSI